VTTRNKAVKDVATRKVGASFIESDYSLDGQKRSHHTEKDVQGCARPAPKPQQLLAPKSTNRDGKRAKTPAQDQMCYHITISDIIFRLYLCEFQSKSFMKPQSVNAAVEVISFWTVPSLTIPLYSRARYIL